MELFDREEGLSRAEIEAMQESRLRETLRLAGKTPFYAKRLAETGPIKKVADLSRLPFTTKDDLRAHYPYGLLATERDNIVRMHASSGTTGSPTAIHYTREDIDTWARLMARCMHMVGIRPRDVFQNTSGYGLFTGGLGIHFGAEYLGCLTIPAGAGNTRRQLKLIQDFGVTVIHIIPSYALYMGETLQQDRIAPDSFPVKIALIGAEPHTEEARQRIEFLLGCRCYNSYGLSEMNGPGVAFECTEQNGLHVWEDAYIFEIVDRHDQSPLEAGQWGELVMTTLTRQGMPVLRYRTGDITRLIAGDCACGRRHRRIDRIAGRVDDMFILKGVNIYPLQIERVLMSFPEVGQNYVIELDNQQGKDILKVRVEVGENSSAGDNDLQKAVTRMLKDEILLTPQVELVSFGGLPKAEGKAVRLIDKRRTTPAIN
ncbi:MAG: phenylacetate--CoA ligase [Desulfarculales bacterium]|jgi:phenylacetate-CoA ligase|nr:phenylacetate--CoA ligase [Desulfarculales bacterium]